MHLRPQALQAAQAMLVQPGLELALGLHLVLQRTQRFQPGAEFGQPARFAVHPVLRGAALFVQAGHLLGQFVQPRLGQLQRFLGLGLLGGKGFDARRVGRLQALPFAGQALAPALELARLFLHAAVLGRQHLDLLLHLRHQRTLLVAGRLRGAHGVLEGGQIQRLLLCLRRQHGGLLLAGHHLRRDRLEFHTGGRLAVGPLRVLLRQLGQPGLGPPPAFDDIADAFLEPAHFQRRHAQGALLRVQFVIGRVMRLAHRFQFGFHRAQLGQA